MLSGGLFGKIFSLIKIWIRTFWVCFCKQKNKEFADLQKFKSATNLGQQMANLKIAKNIGSKICKSGNCHTCRRSANVKNFVSPQICGFPEAWGKMIHEKNLKAKHLVTLSLLSKTSVHTRIQWCHLTKLYKNTIYWDNPFKTQSEWIFKNKYTRINFSI